MSPEQEAATAGSVAAKHDAAPAGAGSRNSVETAAASAAPLHPATDPAPVSAVPMSAAPVSAAHVNAAHGSGSLEAVSQAAAPAIRPGPAEGPASPLRSVNPYAKLDEAATPTLVHASAQRVAVSVHDPVLGELQVRAQAASSSQVQASLSTGSAASQAQLSGQLPALAHFLADHGVAVARLSVDREPGREPGREAGREPDRQMGGNNPQAESGGQPSGSSGGGAPHPGPGGSGLAAAPGGVAARSGADPDAGLDAGLGTRVSGDPHGDLGPASRGGGSSAWSYIDVHA